MILAIGSGGNQLLFFALLGETYTDTAGNDSEGREDGYRESEVHGGDAAIPPVLMYVPNFDAGKAGGFIEIYRGSDDAAVTLEADGADEAGDALSPSPPPLVHAFQISVVERAAQRRLVYTSARSHAFATLTPRKDAMASHTTQRAARRAIGASVPAGDVFGLATMKSSDGQYRTQRLLDSGGSELICGVSLAVSRTRAHARVRLEYGMSDATDTDTDADADAGATAKAAAATRDTTAQGGFSAAERVDPQWTQWSCEYMIDSRSLIGLLPDALLERCV